MLRSRGLAVFAAATGAALLASGATGAPPPVPGQRAALAAVRTAVRAGRLDRTTAAAVRAEIARAVHLVRVLPSARRVHVEIALEQLGDLGGRLTTPRAIAVLGQLRANDAYFAAHGAPPGGTDITDADGVVYRYFAGRCFEFHPLANVSALNAHAAAGDVAATERLADALLARGVPLRGGGIGWEYLFPYAGGQAPWLSGMAQAVAAQAFARAAALVPTESAPYLREARAAFLAIPGRLTTSVAGGPWIRLYSFRTVPVLNAQLQTVLSLQSYASATGDSQASTLAAHLEEAAAATLPRFDSGYWSYYSLAGAPSPLSYHEYVIRLLRRLASEDVRFGEAAARFADYLRQPPGFKLAPAPLGELRFWLSKPATVTASTPAGGTQRMSLGPGWHTLAWPEPKRPGIYPVAVTAVGPAGHEASFSTLPLVRVAEPPRPAPTARRNPAGTGPTSAVQSAFVVGAGIDSPSQAAQAAALGLGLIRLTVPWQPGETTPAPALDASLRALPAEPALALELTASGLPADDADRADLGQYAASLAAAAPSLRDLVLAPPPSLATAPAYADALAAVRAAVRAARPDVAVGPLLDGSAQPGRTAAALAAALVAEGSGADLVEFRPAEAPGAGAWTAGDVGRLEAALSKALGGPAPPVLLDAYPVPATVPASERAGYPGGPLPSAGAVSPTEQAASYAQAVGAASCLPGVRGIVLDRVVDEASAAQPATGLSYASGDPKPAAAAVKREIGQVARGAVVCPGATEAVTPTALTFPARLQAGTPVSIVLGCDRDCLYLVTLERAGGRPVAATRGVLAGGLPARTVLLPARRLPPGRYRLDVRLVSRVNPGPLTRRRSPLLGVG